MKLYTNPASPFARKCRVIAHELGLKLEEIDVNARDNDSLRAVNPLKKIPALVLDDGSALFDSPVICEYLNEIGGGKFFPGMSVWRQASIRPLEGARPAGAGRRHHGCRRGLPL